MVIFANLCFDENMELWPVLDEFVEVLKKKFLNEFVLFKEVNKLVSYDGGTTNLFVEF